MLVVVLLCALKVQVPDIIEDSFSRQSAAERSPPRRPAASQFSQWTLLVDSTVESVVEDANKKGNEYLISSLYVFTEKIMQKCAKMFGSMEHNHPFLSLRM